MAADVYGAPPAREICAREVLLGAGHERLHLGQGPCRGFRWVVVAGWHLLSVALFRSPQVRAAEALP